MNTLDFNRHGLEKRLLDEPNLKQPFPPAPVLVPVALSLIALLLLLFSGMAKAQASSPCPQLPASAGLDWEFSTGPDFVFCRALRADDSQAFGVYLGKDSPFEPKRKNRTETGTIDGQPVYWYRTEVATRANVEMRETLVELDNDRIAHIWFQANTSEQLADTFRQVQQLSFRSQVFSNN